MTITFLTYGSYTSQSIAVVTTAPFYLFIARQSRNASKFDRLYLPPFLNRFTSGFHHSGVASIGPGRALARPLIQQVGPGQARFRCFHHCCLSENNYFDQLNFTFDCHNNIAVTHNRNCNHLSIPSTSSADVCSLHRSTRLFQNHHVTFTSLTLLSANSHFSVYETCTAHLSNYNVGRCPT